VHGGHVNSHCVTSQQSVHWWSKGQKLALVEHPKAADPVVHWYWLVIGHRLAEWHTATLHFLLHE
jgi:hypothetical protein